MGGKKRRARSSKLIKSDEKLMLYIRNIKSDHPLWGYRRVWAYLKFRMEMNIGKNRVYRLLKENGLLAPQCLKKKASRKSNTNKPRANKVNQFWGMDMTKIKLPAGWVYLHVVKDWFTKEIVGYNLSRRSKTQDWLQALDMAVQSRFPHGIKTDAIQLSLITDNGCQPTSLKFLEETGNLGIRQIFTSWCNPKGNADTERVIRTIKEDLVWPYDWDNFYQLSDTLDAWVYDYNNDFPHQSLGYLTPSQFYHLNKEEPSTKTA